MNAHEFVKQHGLDGAKYFLDLPCYSINQLAMLESGLSCDDLKRIVESHELIEICGGIEPSKAKLSVREKFKPKAQYFAIHPTDVPNYRFDLLEQAIADFEACQ